MKRLIAAFSLVLALAGHGLIYPMTAIITEIDSAENLVTIQCCNGNVFEFSGVEDYAEGDLVSCIMWSCGTREVFDDVIISARYAGIAEWFTEIYPNK